MRQSPKEVSDPKPESKAKQRILRKKQVLRDSRHCWPELGCPVLSYCCSVFVEAHVAAAGAVGRRPAAADQRGGLCEALPQPSGGRKPVQRRVLNFARMRNAFLHFA
jgi:hypothetical protein